jgi:exopolysaccharide biosynthesis operon protein EpsL
LVIVLRTLLIAGLILPLFARAHEGDTFRPFVSAGRYYDDNLFRLDRDGLISFQGMSLKGPQADTYDVLQAGVNVDWHIERQQVIARLSKSRVTYSRFSTLNSDGSDNLLQWNWQLGNYWSGQLSAAETVAQTSFSDLNANAAINNLRTSRTYVASAYRQLHPRWQIGAGLTDYEIQNSLGSLSVNDFSERAADVDIAWTTPRGSSLKAQLRLANANFPNRQLIGFVTVDNSYTDNSISLTGNWPYSGLFSFQGNIGYEKREHSTVSQRDYSGVIGNLTANYFPTGKTVFSLNVYRRLDETNDFSSSYRLATGVSLSGLMTFTSKLSLRGQLTYEKADYLGDPGFFLFGAPVRRDSTPGASLSLSYMPIDGAQIDLGVQSGQRNSSYNNLNYKFRSLFANVRMDF